MADYDEADRMDRRLSAQHQIYNTELMWQIKHTMVRHEQEIMILAGVVVVLACALGYDDFRIRRLDAHTHKESLSNIKTGFTGSVSLAKDIHKWYKLH